MIRAAIEAARKELPFGFLVEVAGTRDVEALRAAGERAVLAYQASLAAAGVGIAAVLGGVTVAAGKHAATGFRLKFDDRSPAVLAAIRSQAAELVVEVTTETKAALRSAISRAYVAGKPPRVFAREIRDVVGLTRAQALAVERLGERLAKRGLNAAAIAKSQRAYTEKLHRYRALNIARTETMAAANRGVEEGWRQAQDGGYLSPDAQRRWIVTPDDRLCPLCSEMKGVTTPVGKPFPTPGGGEIEGPPLHPSCRCAQGVAGRADA